MRCITMLAVVLISGGLLAAVSVAATEPLAPELLLKEREESLNRLQQEHFQLQERLKTLECTPVLTTDSLNVKKLQRLQELARDVKSQRQTMADFEGFVKWMSGSLSGYSKYVEAGSVAAGFARVLPIPYAGQAGMFTKFVSHFALSLNAASVSMNKYLGSSQQFVARIDALGPAPVGKWKEITELSRFADDQLLKDMTDTQAKLTTTSELSSSALSFLESIHQYLGSSDEYWAKTKAFLARKEADKAEKSFLTSNIEGLKTRAGNFNAKLKQFDDTVKRSAPQIKSLAAYDELIRELEAKAVQAKGK
ncbi:MAG TPA: hypothetical protein VIU41_14335 [Geobacteraceae bacterium]